MLQENSRNPQGGMVRSLALYSIWHVEGDATYSVPVGPHHWQRFILIRTLAGEGVVRLADGRCLVLPADSLVLLLGTQLRHYQCAGTSWHFWWLEIDALEPPQFPLHEPLQIPRIGEEEALLQLAFAALRQTATAAVATAAVQLLCHEWLARRGDTQLRSPDQERVERLIGLMHRRLDGSLGVTEMAAALHVSSPQLRRVFKAETGLAPKTFYDGIRLEHARLLLTQHRRSIKATAAELGFSSPFHFSRAYRRRFGHPPSQAATSHPF